MSQAAQPAADSRLSVTGWQTAGRLALLAMMVFVARWCTGPTFGYTLFALVWAPITAVYSGSTATKRLTVWLILLAIIVLTAAPWLTIESWSVAGRLTVVLFVSVLAAAGLARLLKTSQLGSATSGAVASLIWLAWLVVPLTMTSWLAGWFGEDAIAKLLSVNPVLTANALSPTAADWTHQALAYKCLTRLGQDVAFDWPTSVWGCVIAHSVAAGLCLMGNWIANRVQCSTWNILPE